MENPEPPKPPELRTRRACQAQKEAKKLKEQREECPCVMMFGENEEVRQRTADKEHDPLWLPVGEPPKEEENTEEHEEGRRQLDALMSGEGNVGDIKKDEEEEEPEERSQELDAAQSNEMGKENGDDAIKEEVFESDEEGLLEANPVGNNINVAIDMDFLRDLELKEEDIGAGNLVAGGDERRGAEQKLVLLDDEEDGVVAEDEVKNQNDENAEQVVNSREAEGEGHDEVLRFEEFVNPGHGEDMDVKKDIAASWLSEMGNSADQSFVVNVELEEDIAVREDGADRSLVDDAEDQVSMVEKVFLFGLWDKIIFSSKHQTLSK